MIVWLLILYIYCSPLWNTQCTMWLCSDNWWPR